VDCEGLWADWSDCSVNCGGGSQSRNYSITVDASHGGSICPFSPLSQQTQACNAHICPCTLTRNAALAGHNNAVMTHGTVLHCEEACKEASWCKSFDWTRDKRKCHLSDDCAEDVGGVKTSYRGNPHDYYSCRCGKAGSHGKVRGEWER